MVESIKGMKLNKGEWAEFYVMLKLLGEGKLYTADNLLRKKLDSYLDVLKIIRQEFDIQVLEYIIDEERSEVVVKPQDTDEIFVSIPMQEFRENAIALFRGIKNIKGMSIPAPDSVCDFAQIIYVSKPKAPAVKALKRQFGGKNDIFIEVRDGQTALVSVMGFSIKSKFGHNPTLFNAGSSSQFLYKLTNCNDVVMNEFNAITDGENRGWAKCKEYLSAHGITMEFARTQNPIYGNNLFLIRESMSKILS
ncbi:MAG: HpaII family restriction endonuclease, partial [Ruminococcus sp.]|nr:HpaII family restriction endonuclease [Ruminococcus sp.]